MADMIQIWNLSKTFGAGDGRVAALRDVTLSVRQGEIFGIIGLSGAGKSTLVRCMNLLERPEAGQILFHGEDLLGLSQRQLRMQRRKIAMVFQGFHLLDQRTALENVCFPMELSGLRKKEAAAKARALLTTVGIGDKIDAYPSQLSGGQKQRVAIARALASDPEVLLCDEATSALDPQTTESILALLRQINQERGITVVLITHQMSVIEQICHRVAILDQGTVVEVGEVEAVFSNPKSVTGWKLVSPDKALPVSHWDGPVARVAFNGTMVEEPVIASLTAQKQILVSILGADTRNVDGRMFGTMLISLPPAEDRKQEALDFLNAYAGVYAEEVT